MLLRSVFLRKRSVVTDVTVTDGALLLQMMERNLAVAGTSWLDNVVLVKDAF